MQASKKTRTMTGLALFTAIIVALQALSALINATGILPFAISLVMIPIVVGAAVYGWKAGAYLGCVFGVVVLIACIYNWDKGGNILWLARPFVTSVLCIVKGGAAGLASGIAYSTLHKKNMMAATVMAAVIGPVVNTGIFCLAMVFLYYDTLLTWAGGTSIIFYVITGLVGINFIIELGTNIILSPVIMRIIKARGSSIT